MQSLAGSCKTPLHRPAILWTRRVHKICSLGEPGAHSRTLNTYVECDAPMARATFKELLPEGYMSKYDSFNGQLVLDNSETVPEGFCDSALRTVECGGLRSF